MKKIAVLVLAAGKSSRMKTVKQLLKINNEFLLNITLNKAKQLEIEQLFCVLGAHQQKIEKEIDFTNIQIINNPNFEEGLSASIVAGLKFFKKNKLNFDGLFVLLGDQPAIKVDYLKDMLLLFKEIKSKIIASKYNQKFGVPAIFPKTLFSELLKIKGDKGAKELLDEKKSDLIFSNLPSNLTDLDTKEDYNKFLTSNT